MTSATVDVLTTGYAEDRVASTVTLIRDGERLMVVDPGMVAHRGLILDPLQALDIAPDDITDVVLSHHHPDHTMNIALFPKARVHDFMATYDADRWIDHEPGDIVLTDAVRMIATPGHTDQDVSTVVRTADGLVVMTHLWWTADGPEVDPFAASQDVLAASRDQVLALGPVLIVPGHGAPFAPR